MSPLSTLPGNSTMLGRLILFTITDEPIFTYSALADLVKDLKLDPRFLPPPNKYLFAFQKAAAEASDLTYPLSPRVTARTLHRQVSASRDRVVSQITREIQSKGRRQPSGAGRVYEEIISLQFFRPSDPDDQSTARLLITIHPDHLHPDELPHVQQIARQIKERYDQYYDFLDGQKVRKVIRSYLQHLNSVEIRGGVYFVHAEYDAELRRLMHLVNRLGGGCRMDEFPIADLAQQRAVISQAFEAEAGRSLQDLNRTIQDLAERRTPVAPKVYDRLRRQYEEVVTRATEHLLKLRIPQDDTAVSADVTQHSLGELGDLVPQRKESP